MGLGSADLPLTRGTACPLEEPDLNLQSGVSRQYAEEKDVFVERSGVVQQFLQRLTKVVHSGRRPSILDIQHLAQGEQPGT